MRKRGDSWLIDIRQGAKGKRIYHTFKGTEAEARELEHSLRRKLGKGIPFDHHTLSSILPDYLADIEMHQTDNTVRNKKKMIFANLLPFFGNLFIDSIPDMLIQQYKKKRLAEIASPTAKGGHRSINLELMCLTAIVKWAGHSLKIKQLPYKASLPNILTREEVIALIDAMTVPHRAMFMCMYVAGMRKKEVFGLTWDRVSFENRSIVVIGKGGYIRMIPMHPMLYDALSLIPKGKNGQLVFPSPATGKVYKDLRKTIESAKKKAGITKRIYPHLLRHCFGTHVYNATGDLQGVSEAMGHKQLSTTRIYSKLSEEHMREVIERGIEGW